LPYSTILVQLLFNCPLDGRDSPVTANATTVILMEKGIDANAHASLWSRSAARSILQKDAVQYCP